MTVVLNRQRKPNRLKNFNYSKTAGISLRFVQKTEKNILERLLDRR